MSTTILTLGGDLEGEIDIKLEPETFDEVTENGFVGFDNTKRIQSTTDVGALNLWTSKATSCLIAQYKKYRSLVGQTNKMRNLREMFDMVSFEMQKFGFFFSAQKCENKWRVLERKYKNLVFRERLKKPGKMRHYGHWEHRRALDEIFNEKKRRTYLHEDEYPPPSGSAKFASLMKKSAEKINMANNSTCSQSSNTNNASHASSSEYNKRVEELVEQTEIIKSFLTKFLDEMTKNMALAERNNERRYREKLAMRQSELEVQESFLRLKEQKLELQRAQLMAAAQHLNM